MEHLDLKDFERWLNIIKREPRSETPEAYTSPDAAEVGRILQDHMTGTFQRLALEYLAAGEPQGFALGGLLPRLSDGPRI